jgi:UPF0716 protein FxsA
VQRFFALLVLVGIVEVTVIIEVSRAIGAVNTVGLLILVSVVGATIVKLQGLTALRRALTDVEARRVPGAALADGALLAAAGALLIIPGFVTDAFGLLLLCRPVRSTVRRVLRRRWSRRFVGSSDHFELEA